MRRLTQTCPTAQPGRLAADLSRVSPLPGIHRLVTIADLDGREFRSRVEDGDGRVLVLARPLTLPLEHDFELGRELLVSWPDPGGVTVATARLVDKRARGSLGLWVTELIGDPVRHQRRQFVRVPAIGPIELMVAGGEPGAPFAHVAGYLLDISEAALRCALRTTDAESVLGAEALLGSFELDGTRFTLAATVLRAASAREDEHEFVLEFQIDERSADELRRRVFAEQLRAHRGAR